MKATEALLVDHKLIRKVLEKFTIDNPDFNHTLKTLQRTVHGHAWFEDEIFLPVFESEPLMYKRFVEEIYQEHKDIADLMALLRKTPLEKKAEVQSYMLLLKTILETHFKKEEDGLFPMAEKILDNEGLNKLGAEMERRKLEIREVVKDYY